MSQKALKSAELILAVGFGLARRDMITDGPRVATATWRELTPALVREVSPDLVIAPAIAPSFDCVEIAERLSACGYGGAFLVVTHNIPDPSVIRRELSGRAGLLRTDVISVDEIAAALSDTLPNLAAAG